MILYHSADLIWATRIKATAEAAGVGARPVRSIEMLEARLADSQVNAVVVDLDAPEIAIQLVQRLRQPNATPTDRKIRVLAFGPHVAVEAFDAARKAGADRVLPRGAFARNLSEWLSALDKPAESLEEATRSLPTTE
jgi:CheY-like chemotaxis protein